MSTDPIRDFLEPIVRDIVEQRLAEILGADVPVQPEPPVVAVGKDDIDYVGLVEMIVDQVPAAPCTLQEVVPAVALVLRSVPAPEPWRSLWHDLAAVIEAEVAAAPSRKAPWSDWCAYLLAYLQDEASEPDGKATFAELCEALHKTIDDHYSQLDVLDPDGMSPGERNRYWGAQKLLTRLSTVFQCLARMGGELTLRAEGKPREERPPQFPPGEEPYSH